WFRRRDSYFRANYRIGQRRFTGIWPAYKTDKPRPKVFWIFGLDHDLGSWKLVWGVTRMVSTRLRRPVSVSTVSVRFSTSVTDPLIVILRILLASKPPTVSTSSSSSSSKKRPKASEKSETDIDAFTSYSPSGWGITS